MNISRSAVSTVRVRCEADLPHCQREEEAGEHQTDQRHHRDHSQPQSQCSGGLSSSHQGEQHSALEHFYYS